MRYNERGLQVGPPDPGGGSLIFKVVLWAEITCQAPARDLAEYAGGIISSLRSLVQEISVH